MSEKTLQKPIYDNDHFEPYSLNSQNYLIKRSWTLGKMKTGPHEGDLQ